MTIFSMIFRGQVRIKRITMNIYVEPTGLNVSVICCLIIEIDEMGFYGSFCFYFFSCINQISSLTGAQVYFVTPETL